MRACSRSSVSKRAAVAALLATLVSGGRGAADDAHPTEAEVKARLAALDVEGARKLLTQFQTDAKTADAKKTAKALENELAVTKKIEAYQKKMAKLSQEKKWREAYATFMSAVDAFPGAAALAALKPVARDARSKAFYVVDDFDEPEKPAKDGAPADPAAPAPAPDPSPKPPEADKKNTVHGWTGHLAEIALVADPMGGQALHWTTSGGKAKSYVDKKVPDPIDIEDYEYATIRMRGSRYPSGTLTLSFSRGEGTYAESITKFEPDGKWHEVQLPISSLQKTPGFDPGHVTNFVLYYKGAEALDLEVDEILLAKKAPKR